MGALTSEEETFSASTSPSPPATLTLTLPILPSRPLTPPPASASAIAAPTAAATPTTSVPTQQTAAHTVLHLPELLEIILLHLTAKDLLLTQRTCRSFRHTTLSSPALQKALFLLPDWKPEARVRGVFSNESYAQFDSRPGKKPENNTLLLRAFSACYYPTVTLRIDTDDFDNNHIGKGSGISEHWSWDVCISFPTHHPPTTSPSVLFPEASWRRMFLSQPPCTSLHLVRRWQRSLHPAIVREGGIKMGEFVDEATREGGGWSMGYVSSDRDWHFEGNIRCSRLGEEGEGEIEKSKAEEFTARLREYLFRSEARVER